MKIKFLAPAETDMIEAAAYYEVQVEKLGVNFLDIIEAAVAEIAGNPETWPEIEMETISIRGTAQVTA